jgi:hypothetical protein
MKDVIVGVNLDYFFHFTFFISTPVQVIVYK